MPFYFPGCGWSRNNEQFQDWTTEEIQWIKKMDNLFTSMLGGDYLSYMYTSTGSRVAPEDVPKLNEYDHEHWEKHFQDEIWETPSKKQMPSTGTRVSKEHRKAKRLGSKQFCKLPQQSKDSSQHARKLLTPQARQKPQECTRDPMEKESPSVNVVFPNAAPTCSTNTGTGNDHDVPKHPKKSNFVASKETPRVAQKIRSSRYTRTPLTSREEPNVKERRLLSVETPLCELWNPNLTRQQLADVEIPPIYSSYEGVKLSYVPAKECRSDPAGMAYCPSENLLNEAIEMLKESPTSGVMIGKLGKFTKDSLEKMRYFHKALQV